MSTASDRWSAHRREQTERDQTALEKAQMISAGRQTADPLLAPIFARPTEANTPLDQINPPPAPSTPPAEDT